MKIRTFLINLDERIDRLEDSALQLASNQITYTRVSAINAENVEESTFLTPTVLACWKSHLKAYSLLLESDSDYALILEDDFLIKSPRQMANLIDNIQASDADLIQVGFLLPGLFIKFRWIYEELEKFTFFLIGQGLHVTKRSGQHKRLRILESQKRPLRYTTSSFLPGTHTYIISRRMASEILKNQTFNLSADEYFIALAKMRSFEMVRYWRSLVTQNDSIPSIRGRFILGDPK